MIGEEFDLKLPFGKEARREAIRNHRLDLWGKKFLNIMIISLVIGIILNTVAFILNNVALWCIAVVLLDIGFCSGIILIIMVSKW